MPLVINTNVASLNAQRHLQASRSDLETAMERLSSGKRINSAMEDAAGLTIAHSLETKIKSLETAARNANDAISLIHLAEGAMDAVSSMLVRMRELATQALNGTYSDDDRANLDAEFQQLSDEITRISDNTYFNGISVIGQARTVGGSGTGAALSFQIGYDASDSINLATSDIDSATIGVVSGNNGGTGLALSGQDLTSLTKAGYSLSSVDQALSEVDQARVAMGAVANRLDHSIENLYSRIEQQTAAKSRIEDADYAVESANLARAQVLQQAGTAMLAQANASTMNVLSLLK
jgi:flagellin